MNVDAPIEPRVYDRRMWWVMVAGCAARFSAERDVASAATGFVFWVVIFAVCWIVRAWALAQHDSPRRLQAAGNAVAVFGLLLFLLRLNSDGLVPALLTFLFAIQAAVFVTATKRLHVWLNLAAALGGVLFAAAESRSPWFLLGAVWFTFAGLGLLVLDQRIDRARTMLVPQNDVRSRGQGGVAFATLALLIAMPLYLFVPKPAGWLLGGMQAHSAHDSRDTPDREPRTTPDDVLDDSTRQESEPEEPTDSNTSPLEAKPEQGDYGSDFSADGVQRDRASANHIVLFVKSSEPIYLRGLVYDRFENNRWHRDPQPSRELTLARGNLELPYRYGDERIQQTIEAALDLTTTLWHAPGVHRLRFPGPRVRRFEDDVFVVAQPIRAETVYSIESRLTLRDGRYVLIEPMTMDPARYLSREGASERLRALASSIVGTLEHPRAKAFALEHHLRETYEYTYDTVPQQGYTPLDAFLFESKRGHCEYFASALAMMLRAIDVPSRVVTGFSLGEPNPVTGYYEVRGLDGHAWVEAYIDGGWLMLEPTPFYPLPHPEGESQVAAQMDRYLDRLAQTSALLEPESLTAVAASIARDAWRSSRQSLSAVVETVRSRAATLVMGIVLIVALIAIGYLVVLILADALHNREVRRVQASARAAEADQSTLLTAQALEMTGLHRGFARLPGMSFQEYVQEIIAGGLRISPQFAETFDAARYGPGASSDSSEILSGVTATIESQLARDPYPRLRRALERWRNLLLTWLNADKGS